MIEVDNLTKRFRKTVAVENLSFKIREGAVTAFLGSERRGQDDDAANHPRSRPADRGPGNGHWASSTASSGIRSHEVGAVLEASSFHPGRSGRNHLRTVAAASGIPPGRGRGGARSRPDDGGAGRRVGGYSLGMKQRLSLAAALLGDPRVLVLDEPANGLDPQGMRWLRELLRSLAAEGRTILISSHVLAEVEQMADEVVIIHRGRFVEQASTAELFARAGGGIRVRSPAAERFRAILEEAGLTVGSAEGDLLVVGDGTTERMARLAAEHGIVLHELAAEKSTLEEAFLELTEHETTR